MIALAVVVLGHWGVLATLASLRIVAVPQSTDTVIIEVINALQNVEKALVSAPQKPAAIRPESQPVLHQAHPRPAVETPMLATQKPLSDSLSEGVALPVVLPSSQASAQPAATTSAPQSAPRFDADYLDNPAPIYPSLSRRVGEEGKVVLRVFVEPSGRPGQIEVRTSSGFERLDKSATSAVGRWKFIPAHQGANAVGAWVLVPIVFSLKA